MRNRIIIAVAVLAAAGAVAMGAAGCKANPAKGGDMVGRWEPTKLAVTTQPVPGTYVEFGGDGTTNGFSGLNTFAGPYAADPKGALSIGPLASTRIAGPTAAMVGEQAFLDALGKAKGFTVEGKTLTMYDAKGAMVAEFKPAQQVGITDVDWVLTAHNNGKDAVVSTASSTQITLKFDRDGQLGGKSGCGTYAATYTVDAQTIQIGKPRGVKTEPCPIELSTQRSEYLDVLPTSATWRITVTPEAGGTVPRLELRDAKGAMTATYKASMPK